MALIALLLACGSSLPGDEACGTGSELQQAWCRVQLMEAAETLEANTALALCDGMATGPRDLCLEVAVRRASPVPAVETCEGIQDAVLQDSCHLAWADRAGPQLPIEEHLAACRAADSLAMDCLVHLPRDRGPSWRHLEDGTLRAELTAIAAAFPEIAQRSELGMQIGIELSNGGKTLSLCDALPPMPAGKCRMARGGHHQPRRAERPVGDPRQGRGEVHGVRGEDPGG